MTRLSVILLLGVLMIISTSLVADYNSGHHGNEYYQGQRYDRHPGRHHKKHYNS